MVKWSKSKKTGYTDEARSLSRSALGYQSSLERLLADISIKLINLQVRSWSKHGFESNWNLTLI